MGDILHYVIERIPQIGLSNLHKHRFVFPTRRSGLIFKNMLLKEFDDQVFWSPQIQSIEDFILDLSSLTHASDLEVIGEMYKVYKKYDKDLTLDEFYDWGEVLLKDFDEVDRYLRDGTKLYTSLKEMREIDTLFHSDEEALEIIKRFRTVSEQTKTDLFAQFARTWEIVVQVYPELSEVLLDKQIGYMGLLYRDVAYSDLENLINSDKVHFIGFNAISRSEEVIMEKLVDAGRGEVYWDIQESTLTNTHDHSGKFLREYHKKWESRSHHWVTQPDHSINTEVYSCSGHMTQARAASNLLGKSDYNWNETAIVLGDEKLLIPLLYSLPDNEELINITMGYPVKNHPLVHFIKAYMDLQSSIVSSSKGNFCISVKVLDFLNNPFLKIVGNNFQYQSLKLIRERKWEMVPLTELEALLPEENASLFKANDPVDIIPELTQILDYFFETWVNYSGPAIEKEALYSLRKHLNQFEALIRDLEEELNCDFLWRLLKQSLGSLRVNFSGEPIRGLQVMGFLESRVLSFKNVFVLSVNEGHLPQQKSQPTYIPFSLRKVFGLPTFEERDAIYGYHFKRLLSHAENVNILYNSELAYDGTGEMSRFVRQMELESTDSIKNFTLNIPQIKMEETQPPTVKRNRTIQEKLHRFVEGQTDLFEAAQKITPTALVSYIQCPLQFYFKYVLRLRETEPDTLEMEPRDFGNLFHQAMESIYRPYLGEPLKKEDFDQFLKKGFINERVDEAFREEFPGNLLKGRNLFYARISEKLIRNILRKDLEMSDLKILELETESLNQLLTPTPGLQVKVGGIVDRIDETRTGNGVVHRIIDYKTGQVEEYRKGRKTREEYLDGYFTNYKLKSGFQVYFYSYLYKKKYPERAVMPGIYSTNNYQTGITYLWEGQPLDDEFMVLFEERLFGLLKTIFEESQEFEPVEDTSKCEFCPYASICLRHQKKPS